MITVAFYDAKPYDHDYFACATEPDAPQWRFHEFRLTADTALTARGAEAVCVFVNDKVDAACLERLKEIGVQLVALRCTGFNNVDVDAAARLGIAVVRVPGYSPYAVAEHSVALLLALNRKIHRAYNRVREHNFSITGFVGFDLHAKTIGIVGTGKIGKVAARIFHGFGTNLLAYDTCPDEAWAAELGLRYVGLEELLSESHVISLYLPLTPDSFHLLNARTFSLMKPGAILVNTSRGKIVDTRALVAALKSGTLGGVALDVYEEEEAVFFEDHSGQILQDDMLARLLTFPNVLVTAHQAFFTHEALSEIARMTIENLHRLANRDAYLPETILVDRKL